MAARASRTDAAGSMASTSLPAITLLLLVVAACAGRHGSETVLPADWAWPEQDPRIRLHEMIDLEATSRSGRGRLLRWLGEEVARPSFRRPYAVAWETDNLVVADPDTRMVARIHRNGRMEYSPAGLFRQPIGLAVCWEGIVVSDSYGGGVALLGPDLRLVRWLAEGLSRPTGLACSGEVLYVAETGKHRILELRRDGDRRILGNHGNGPGQYNFPTSIAVGDGMLFVGDAMNFRIQRIALPSGEFIASFGALGDSPGEMPRTKGIAVDSEGHLWVADAYLDQVALYDETGNLLISIGGRGSGPGQFSFPAGVSAHPDGRVAVVDSLNRRLKVFRVVASTSPDGA